LSLSLGIIYNVIQTENLHFLKISKIIRFNTCIKEFNTKRGNTKANEGLFLSFPLKYLHVDLGLLSEE
jgi:hypothetical protein